MKLTQRQLRKIINEETQKLNENKRVKAIARRADKRLNEQRLSSLSNSQGMQSARQMIQSSSVDAVKIYKALKGLGTDEDAVYEVLNKRQNSIPALYEEYNVLMMELKEASSGFMGKVKKYGMPFLAGSGLFTLALSLSPDKAKAVEDKIRKGAYLARGGRGDIIPGFDDIKDDPMGSAMKGAKNVDAALAAVGDVPPGSVSSRLGKGLEKRIADKVNPGIDGPGPMPDKLAGTGKLSTGQKIAGAALSGAAVAAVAALIGSILPDSLDDDLVDWLEDDGMDDAAQFVLARLRPGQRAR